jgi:hypothetical protein
MDGAVLREDSAPTAFSFHAAQMRLSPGPLGAGSRAMRGLPETIAQCLGANADRFEQDVVFRVS